MGRTRAWSKVVWKGPGRGGSLWSHGCPTLDFTISQVAFGATIPLEEQEQDEMERNKSMCRSPSNKQPRRARTLQVSGTDAPHSPPGGWRTLSRGSCPRASGTGQLRSPLLLTTSSGHCPAFMRGLKALAQKVKRVPMKVRSELPPTNSWSSNHLFGTISDHIPQSPAASHMASGTGAGCGSSTGNPFPSPDQVIRARLGISLPPLHPEGVGRLL